MHLFTAVLLLLAAFPIREQQQIFDVHVHLHRGEVSLGEYMAQATSGKLHVAGFGAMWFGGPNQALQGEPDRIRANNDQLIALASKRPQLLAIATVLPKRRRLSTLGRRIEITR